MLCPCDFGTQPAQRLEGIAAGVQGRTLSAGFVRAGKLPGFCRCLRSLPCCLHREYGAEFPGFCIKRQSLFFHFYNRKLIVCNDQLIRQNEIIEHLPQKNDGILGVRCVVTVGIQTKTQYLFVFAAAQRVENDVDAKAHAAC